MKVLVLKTKIIKQFVLFIIMFKQILISNAFFVRSSRDLFKKDSGNTTTGGLIFPYRLGGVDNKISTNNAVQIMGNNCRQEFANIYGNLLSSVVNKDQAWLQKHVQHSLINPLLSRSDIKQTNKQSKIQILFYQMSIGIGVKFQKEDYQYQILAQQQNIKLYADKQLLGPKMLASAPLNLPALISFYVGVRSMRKLTTKDKAQDKKEQMHLLTIEKGPQVQMQKVLSMAMTENNSAIAFKKMFLESKQPWRIGNIDQFLKKRV